MLFDPIRNYLQSLALKPAAAKGTVAESGMRVATNAGRTPANGLMRNSQKLIFLMALLFVFVSSGQTWAHPGHYHPPEEVDEFEQEAFFSAAAHPFTSWDHLLTMLAAGALAAGGRRVLGAVFVVGVAAGFVSGLVGPGWLLALVVMGGVLWKGPPSIQLWAWLAVGLTGFLHGGAHAGEMIGASAGLGLFAGTLAGVELVIWVMRRLVPVPPVAVRHAGACVAVMGVLLTVACVSPG